MSQSLIRAVRRGDAAETARLLSAGDDPDFVHPGGCRPLHVVCGDGPRQGAAAIVRTLLAAGADPNGVGPRRRRPLHHGVRRFGPDAIRVLVEGGAEIDARDVQGKTALALAAHQGRTVVLTSLLDLGADPNLADLTHHTALHHAARSGALACLKILLARGADIHATDAGDRTALHFAARRRGKPGRKCAAHLIDGGALLSPDLMGRTAVDHALGVGAMHTAARIEKTGEEDALYGLRRLVEDDPMDDERWAVYADLLEARRDPLGEFINLELARDRAEPGPMRARIDGRHARRWSQLHPRLLGRLSDAEREGLEMVWRRGHLHRVRAHTAPGIAGLAKLLPQPAARFLQSFESPLRRDRSRSLPVLERTAPNSSLRHVVLLAEGSYLHGVPQSLERAAPLLRRLEIRDAPPILHAFRLAELHSLSLSFVWDRYTSPYVSSCSLPRLQALELDLVPRGTARVQMAEAILALSLGALSRLKLRGVDQRLLSAVLQSEVAPRLEVLELHLCYGDLTETIRAHSLRLRRLKRLDIEGIGADRAAIVAEALGCEVVNC